jgi:hypothetical protein
MHVAARARLVIARRPWIYWSLVACLAAVAGLTVLAQVSALERARLEWGTTRAVLVADRSAGPGDEVAWRRVELPVAALPPGAVERWPDGGRLRQRIGEGEVLTEVDLASVAGPAGRADAGTVVVALSDPLSHSIGIGLRVQVAADGLIVADDAVVVDVADDVTFVAVERRDAATVAAAAQQGLAVLLYLP